MSLPNNAASRRNFLKSAGVLAAAAACAPGTPDRAPTDDAKGDATLPRDPARNAMITTFNGPLLAALGDTVLPQQLGAAGITAAVQAFVTYCREYTPVAEEMHGYGYAEIRYLPPDPVPAWQAQLDGLELLAQHTHKTSFAALTRAQRQALVTVATRRVGGGDLPSPLHATHVAIALMSHWSTAPAAWNLAMGVELSPLSCRTLEGTTTRPVASTGRRA